MVKFIANKCDYYKNVIKTSSEDFVIYSKITLKATAKREIYILREVVFAT